jgi:ribonuclease PH
MAALIKDAFDRVIQAHLLPRSEICLTLTVLEQDGGKSVEKSLAPMHDPTHTH